MDAETHTHVYIYIYVYDYMCMYANRMYVFLRLYNIYICIVYCIHMAEKPIAAKASMSNSLLCWFVDWLLQMKSELESQNPGTKIQKGDDQSFNKFWSIFMNKSFSTDLELLLNPRYPRLLLHILARATAPLQASEAVLPTYQSQRLDHFHLGLTFVKLRNLQKSSKIIENCQYL